MILLVALPALVLAMVAVNAASWRRPRPILGAAEDVRVHIPARNEAARIGATLQAVVPQAPVTVLDDRSIDGTGERAESLGATVVAGEKLPDGWVGKPWAVHQLGEGSTEDVLVFLDADVVLVPGAVASIVSELDSCDVFTAVPHQATGGLAEDLVLPLLHLTYVAWLPLILVEWLSDPRFLAANGQLLAMRRSTWDGLGGFTSARAEVVDDMAFCGAAKRAGMNVRFADGELLGSTRMYSDLRSVVEGFSKNIHEGLGSGIGVVLAVALYLVAFVVPYVGLVVGLFVRGLFWPSAVAVGLNVLVRGLLAWRHGHSLVSVLLHPVGVLLLCAIALNSWRWSRRSEIRWAGRVYRAKDRR